MAFELFPVVQWFDNSGSPLAGGLISTFAAGTTTPLASYTDSTGGTPNANPVVLDSAGRAQIWFAAASYKLVLKTAAGATLMTIDNISLDNLAATISSLSMTGNLTMQQATAATSGANQSSNIYALQGNYWNGSASATDQWQVQDVLGTGSNPTSTLSVTHSGSSGTVTVSIPSAPVSIGNNLAVGGTLAATGATTLTGAVTASTSVTSPALISSTASPASAGAVRLANTDAIKWRNNAGGADVALQKSGAVSGDTPADSLDASGFGGLKTVTLIATGGASAQSGLVRGANNSALVVARNAANSGDVNAVLVNGSNLVALGSGPFLIPAASDTAVGKATTDTLTNKTLTSPAVTNLTDTAITQIKRIKANQGTTLVSGDFSLSAGWGSTASISTVVGTDAAFQITISSSGTGQGANPTVTLTFHDGTWTNSPIVVVGRGDASGSTGGNGIFAATSISATQLVITFITTPTAGSAYALYAIAMGR